MPRIESKLVAKTVPVANHGELFRQAVIMFKRQEQIFYELFEQTTRKGHSFPRGKMGGGKKIPANQLPQLLTEGFHPVHLDADEA